MLYKVFDLVVDSEIPLLDFEQVQAGHPALFVKQRLDALDMPADLVWTDVWSKGWSQGAGTTTRPNPVWRFAWHGPDLLITIAKCGEFRLEDGFRTLICRGYSTTSDWALRSQLSYNLVPGILGEIGHLVVHASCVSFDSGGSVLFIGPSGAGKSTLAASFVGNGGRLLSDDCVLLRTDAGHLHAHVTGAVARLWEDSLTNLGGEYHDASLISRTPTGSKWSHRTGPDTRLTTGTRVEAIFHVKVGDGDVTIAEEPGSRLLSVLTDAALMLNPLDKPNRSRRFLTASEMANACPAFYSLRYPRAFDRLPDVRRAVVAKVRESRHVSLAR